VIVYIDKHRMSFQIDEEDSFAVSRYMWHLDSDDYPATAIGKWPHNNTIRLHVFLMGKAPKGLLWDHINRDKRDNRRANLRMVTPSGNGHNRGLLPNNKSGHNGVYWHKRHGKWSAQIRMNGKSWHLGLFTALEDAVRARSEAEKSFWFDHEMAVNP